MFNTLKTKIKEKLCKHEYTADSSCPYTMKTYTYCNSCSKRVRVVQSN